MKDTKLKLIDNAIGFIAIALSFLVPIFFLPITGDYFEFNKLYLLVFTSLALLVLWGIKIIATKKFSVASTSLDLPIFLLLAVVVLSSIFSINKQVSIFGQQGRWFPSLVGIAAITVIYYAISSNIYKEIIIKRAVIALVLSGTISTIVTFLGYYNKPLQIAGNAVFALTGSISTSTMLAAIAGVFSLILLVNENKKVLKAIFTAATIVNLALVLIMGTTTGWLALVLGLVGLAYFTPVDKVKSVKSYLYVITGFTIVTLLMVLVPTTAKLITNANYPKELTLQIPESWVVTSSSIRDFPLLGSGPSTFYLNFSRYKPLSLNTGDLWLAQYDKPFNALFDILGTLGILGFGVAILLGFTVFKFVTKVKSRVTNKDITIQMLGTGIIVTSALLLVTNANITNVFLLFFFLALMVSRVHLSEEADMAKEMSLSFVSTATSGVSLSTIGAVRKEYFHLVIAAPVFALAIFGFMTSYKVYLAEVYFRNALTAATSNNGSDTYTYIAKAISTNPQRDAYHNLFAQVNLALANSVAGKKDLTDTDKQNVQNLIAQAIKSSRASSEVVNPLDPVNWEVRANIYRALIGSAQNADQWAISAFNNAIQLDPTNPRLRLNLGGIYYANKDYLSAANQFKQAANLKADYANAYYNFGEALLQLKDYKNALAALEMAQSLVVKDSADYKKLAAELETLNKMPEIISATSDKPTVESIAKKAEPQTVNTNQEPLSNPSVTNTTSNVKDIVRPSVTPTPVPTATPTPTPTPTTTPSPTPTPEQ